MSRVADLDRYLRAHFAAEAPLPTGDGAAGPRPFITISRQSGVGGHALADAIVEGFTQKPDQELFASWKVYDRSLCELVASDPRFASSLDSLIEEEYRSKADDFFHQLLRSTADQNVVMDRVFLTVRTVAAMGKTVIIGRAGSHVTKDMPGGLSLRVVGPEAWRLGNIVDRLDLPPRRARAEMEHRDAARARLLRAHFGVDIDDPTGYDAVLNLGRMSTRDVVELAASLVTERAGRAEAIGGSHATRAGRAFSDT
jgi:cytidylate kinase